MLSNPREIREEAMRFYQSLYGSELEPEDRGKDFFLENLPNISEESKKELESALTLGELYGALQSMESGKTPGIDGLPAEFLKTFWSEIGVDLLEVFNDSLLKGRLPLSCRRAVVTLLPKKGDLTEIKNWRPVSLLCSDYKLLSKTLAVRLAKVMGQVIHPDQSYCVPNRSIFDNISFIRDIIQVSKLLDIKCGLLSLDQEKAFDRVEHSYLWNSLEAFGFHEKFLRMLKILYSDIESVIKIKGGLCAPFKVNRGIRQGCSLSGMLYSIAIEPLLQQIGKRLDGLRVPQCDFNFSLSAYADDVIIIINKQEDIHVLSKLIDEFGKCSSAKVNWKKSDALLLGDWNDGKPTLPEGLCWSRWGIRYLGVFLGDESVLQKSLDGMLQKVRGRLDKWKWLLPNMSFRGRTLIVNNLVASLLWHRLACTDPPAKLLAEIQAIFVDFFWDKLHWIPQSMLYLPKDEGGQGLIHLQSRIAIFWLHFIQRFLDGPVNVSWRAISGIIPQTVGSFALDRSLFLMDPKSLNLSQLPPFYRNLYKVWSFFHIQNTENFHSIYWLLREPLICKARLDISSSNFLPGFSKVLQNSGVFVLGQLLSLTGPHFKDTEAVAKGLGFRSIRSITRFLAKLTETFTSEEKLILEDFFFRE